MSCLTCVLGTKLRFSVTAVCTLTSEPSLQPSWVSVFGFGFLSQCLGHHNLKEVLKSGDASPPTLPCLSVCLFLCVCIYVCIYPSIPSLFHTYILYSLRYRGREIIVPILIFQDFFRYYRLLTNNISVSWEFKIPVELNNENSVQRSGLFAALAVLGIMYIHLFSWSCLYSSVEKCSIYFTNAKYLTQDNIMII